MEDGRSKETRKAKPPDEEKLHQKIGRQAVETDFLKKVVAAGIAQRVEMAEKDNKQIRKVFTQVFRLLQKLRAAKQPRI